MNEYFPAGQERIDDIPDGLTQEEIDKIEEEVREELDSNDFTLSPITKQDILDLKEMIEEMEA